jgi:transposase-like protein
MSTARRSRRFWEGLFSEVERDGSVVEVARRRGVSDRTLAWWCWKLRGERRGVLASSAEPQLVQVLVREPEAPRPESGRGRLLVVEVAGVRVGVEPGTDVQYVAALVGALRAC